MLLLPKIFTSKIQPCDQGVIRSIKVHYRARLNRVLLATEVNGISLYMALSMVRAAWTIDVKKDVIRNAWVHTGLLAGLVEETQIEANAEENEEENDDGTENLIPPPSTAQCFTMLQSVKARFMASTGEIPDSLLQVEDELMRLPQSQAI